MTITAGTRLGAYEIVAPLGAGGMGEVYRARDSRLKRDVALKVLPAALAGDQERLARFQREAEVLASLNHPHIAQIFGIDETDGRSAIVMELVEGEDLAQRIERGPLPLDEALAIARQIAEALEAAHDAGVVHRDLKPANVKVRADGTVKVLDFGLAKALDTGRSGPHSLAHSPTITSPAMTLHGVILGTAAYMAPEQARGRPVDRRADIWAFGCVVYEMLAGQKAFAGEDVTDLIAAVLTREPDWSRLPKSTPAPVRRLLQRCLEKTLQKRLPHIGLVRLEFDAPPEEAPAAVSPPRAHARARTATAVGIVAALAVGLAAGIWWTSRQPEQAAAAYRSSLILPEDTNFNASAPSSRFAISPDGARVAYIAEQGGNQDLWLQSLAALEPQVVARTRNAFAPFWAPDSRAVAFFVDGQLMKVDLAGGQPTAIGNSPLFRQAGQTPGTWSADGTIIVSTGPTLSRIVASGGVPEPITALDQTAGEDRHLFPHFLPDGRHFFYTAYQGLTPLAVYAAPIDNPANRVKVMDGASNVQYADGALLYLRNAAVIAQPFDPDRRVLSGEGISIADRVLFNVALPFAGAFSASRTGVLVHQRLGPAGEASDADETQLVWRSRDGGTRVLLDKQGGFRQSAISPDGGRAVMSRFDSEGFNLWTLDLARGVRSRLTFDSRENAAVWMPDNRTVIFNSWKAGRIDLYRKTVDAASPAAVVLSDGLPKTPMSVSADGRFLLYAAVGSQTGNDIWVMPLDGSAKPRPFISTPFEERWPQFSRDGQAVVYASDESGNRQIYVRAFPSGDAQLQISSDGGDFPRWSFDGREVFFYNAGKILAASLRRSQGRLEVTTVAPLFDCRLPAGFRRQFFDVAPDGRFLMMSEPSISGPTALTLTVNWPALLRGSR